METYSIVRYYKEKHSKVIKTGLSLEDAKQHCNRRDTKGEDWFDGFVRE